MPKRAGVADAYREFVGEAGFVLVRRDRVSGALMVSRYSGCPNLKTAILVEGRQIFVNEEYAVVRDWLSGLA